VDFIVQWENGGDTDEIAEMVMWDTAGAMILRYWDAWEGRVYESSKNDSPPQRQLVALAGGSRRSILSAAFPPDEDNVYLLILALLLYDPLSGYGLNRSIEDCHDYEDLFRLLESLKSLEIAQFVQIVQIAYFVPTVQLAIELRREGSWAGR
jgi:hypothetical protein